MEESQFFSAFFILHFLLLSFFFSLQKDNGYDPDGVSNNGGDGDMENEDKNEEKLILS